MMHISSYMEYLDISFMLHLMALRFLIHITWDWQGAKINPGHVGVVRNHESLLPISEITITYSKSN